MPNHLTLAEMALHIRQRRLSPVELVDAHLKAIERENPRLNAFISVYADEARAEAKRKENQPAERHLHGVPVTIKDSFDIAGKPTTGGSTLRREAIAREDAVSVARLKQAGAIVLGKTNLPEFLLNYESDNNLIGRTNNPHDLERTPGGSSGGEAAAISAFCSAGGIGSDAGGSIRVPAAFCGIVGLKPTPGRCPGYGHWPSIAHPGGLIGVGGPLARTAQDVRLLFETLSGHDVRDPFSSRVEWKNPVLDGIRVGVMEQFIDVPVQPAMRKAVQKAVSLLHLPAVPFDTKPLRKAPNLWWFLFGELSAQFVFESIQGVEDKVHWTATEWIEPLRNAPPPTSRRVCEVLAERDRLRGETLVRMQRENTPLIVAPCGGVVAWRHRCRKHRTPEKEISGFEAMMPVTIWNTLGFPALTIPMGKDEDGLPTGIQIIGAPNEEEMVLELGARLEARA